MTAKPPMPPQPAWLSAGPAILRLVILVITGAGTLAWVYVCGRLWLAGTGYALMVPATFAFVAFTLSAMVLALKRWHLNVAAALAVMSITANWHVLSALRSLVPWI